MTTSLSAVAAAASDRRPLISLDQCSLTLGATPVLRDVGLEVLQGEFLALLGPSGCGKSTLLRVLLGLVAAGPGGRVLRRDPRPAMGIVFQRPTLLPWRTARAQVELCLRLGPTKVASAEERMRRADRALELVGLTGFAGHYPHQLSGGMQQRVAIARALVAEPSLLLLDEPFGALDELTRAAMNQELLRLWERSETPLQTVVLVTHSVTEALLMADRVVVFTGRPAHVAAIFNVDFGKPRSERFSRIEGTAHFQEMRRAVRAELQTS
jgi:ABC-type nitrate/sulfonate/bicarbonate transport system ATPase subunit